MHLRTLCLHLDLPSTPFPTWWEQLAVYDYIPGDIYEFGCTLGRVAATLAPLLGPSVDVLQLARPFPYASGYSWLVHRIIRQHVAGGKEEVRAQYDSELSVRHSVFPFAAIPRCVLTERRISHHSMIPEPRRT